MCQACSQGPHAAEPSFGYSAVRSEATLVQQDSFVFLNTEQQYDAVWAGGA